jgi:hypothetical protein
VEDGSKRVDCIELYRESPTWQGLAVTSRSSTSLPVVGSDSWVRLVYVGRDGIFMHRGVSLARSARCPIRSRSDMSYRTVITVRYAVIPTELNELIKFVDLAKIGNYVEQSAGFCFPVLDVIF